MAAIPRHVLVHPPAITQLPPTAFSLASLAPRACPRPLPLRLAYLPSTPPSSPQRSESIRHSLPHRRALSSKRPLVTSAAAATRDTTEPLDRVAPPPPPRNAGVTAVPGVNDIRPPESGSARALDPTQPSPREEASVSLESSSPAPSPATSTSSDSHIAESKTRPKSKLRPLRAAIKLTPAAVIHIKALLDQPEPKLLRIGTRRRGCSGLAYHLEYVDKADKFDEVVQQDGVEVLVEGRALLTVLGSTMDWVDEKLGSRFVFTNPNIKEQCGCGESFMV